MEARHLSMTGLSSFTIMLRHTLFGEVSAFSVEDTEDKCPQKPNRISFFEKPAKFFDASKRKELKKLASFLKKI